MARGSGREAGAPCQAPGRVARRGRVAIGCAAALALTAWGPSAAVAAPAEVVAKLRAVKAPRSELRQTRAVTLPGGATVYRFGQQVEGLRVLDGEAVVIEGPGGAPELVGDATRAGI